MPSPTSTTVPTLRVSASASNVSIADLMMLTISSDLMAIGYSWACWRARALRGARHEAFSEALEATPDAGVIEGVADADGEPADQRFVDLDPEVDGSTGHLGDLALQGSGLVAGERHRRPREGLDDAALRVQEAVVLGRDAGKAIDPASLDEQSDELAHRLGHAGRKHPVDELEALAQRSRRIPDDVAGLLTRQHLDGEVKAARVCVERVVARGQLERGLGVAAPRGLGCPGHGRAAYFAVPEVGSARNSSTRRRWRWSVMVSRTTRPAAWRASSATSPRSSASARPFSASISSVARTRIRSSSSRVAAMSASRVSWATFWARARMSFASRRASASVVRRSCSAFSRSWRACSASRRPCSIRSRRAASMPLTCLPKARYRIVANTRKFAEATAIPKQLITRPPLSAAWAATPPAARG